MFELMFRCGDGITLEGLEGAVFELGCRCGSMRTARSDARGVCCFQDLAPGTYRLAEVIPPPGFRMNPKVYCCTVTPAGCCYINGILAERVMVVSRPRCGSAPE